MNSNQIQKYNKKTQPQLLSKAREVFNAYIRERDKGKVCVSCGQFKVLQCGHFYSSGHHPELRFNENNCHGQCVRCNCDSFLSGNLNEYRRHITKRITESELIELDRIADYWKRNSFKWDRFTIIDVIETYKIKLKELK